MPNAARTGKIAQWILSLATTPGRAAATIGDLLEEADTRGSLWFWSSVIETTCSLCWREFCSAPLRIIRLGFRGWLGTFLWPAVLVLPIGLLVRFTRPYSDFTNPLFVGVLTIVSEAFGGFMAGWNAAKNSEGRELPAAFSVTLAIAVVYGLVGYWDAWQLHRYGHPLPRSPYPLAEDCLEVFFAILGAVLFRFSTRGQKVSGVR